MFEWWVGAMWRPQMPLSHLKSPVPSVYPHVQQLYHRDWDGHCILASSQRMLLRSRSWQQTLCWPKPSPLHAIMHWAIDDISQCQVYHCGCPDIDATGACPRQYAYQFMGLYWRWPLTLLPEGMDWASRSRGVSGIACHVPWDYVPPSEFFT